MPLNSREKRFYQRFGRLLARVRGKASLSQENLAAALGLSRTSVTNIEAGRQPVQLHTIYRIADLLEVELTSLLPGASDAVVSRRSETSLEEKAWLQRIVPHGDLKNANTRKDTAPGKQNTQRQ